MPSVNWNLIHREDLLQQLADALKEHEDHKPSRRLSDLKVTLYCGKAKLLELFSLQLILDYLVNDTYWGDGEDGFASNWSHADKLTVETY